MNYNDFKRLIVKDLKRYVKKDTISIKDIIIGYYKYIGFKITLIMRLCKYLESKKKLKLIYYIIRIKYRIIQVKYGVQISHNLNIKGGLKITHYGTIVLSSTCIIGENLDIRHGTTIGKTNHGSPIIGDNVYIGANCTIIGDINIGDNVIIGAGSVVVKDIPDNCIVAGNPAKLIKQL